MLSKEEKTKFVKEFAKSENDTGSYDVQIALLSKRIRSISKHLKSFPKDTHSKLGLIKLVGKRRSFYSHLKKTDNNNYQSLMKKLKDKDYI